MDAALIGVMDRGQGTYIAKKSNSSSKRPNGERGQTRCFLLRLPR